MNINNISIGIKLQVFPITLKYITIKRPSFIEYLIITLIINYPNKSYTLADAIKKEFNINNTFLISKVLNSLIVTGVIKYSTAALMTVNKNDVHSKLDSLIVDDYVKRSFDNKEYIISNDSKSKNAYLVFNPLKNELSISIKEIKSEIFSKKNISCVLESQLVSNINPISIIKLSEEYIKNNYNEFGSNASLDKVIVTNNEINQNSKLEVMNISAQVLSIINSSAEIFDDNFIIKTNDIKIDDYLNKNNNLLNVISKEVINKYSELIKADYAPKRGDVNYKNYSDNYYSLEEIYNYNDFDVLFINNEDVISIERLFKQKKFIDKADFIVIFNSKYNDKKFDILDKKIIFYLDHVNIDFLNLSTISFLSKSNTLKVFGLLDINVKKINTYIPSFAEIKYNQKFSLDNLLSSITDYINNIFEALLVNKKFDKLSYFYKFMIRVDKYKEVDLIIKNYLKTEIRNLKVYKDLREAINSTGINKLLNRLENIIFEIADEAKQNNDIDLLYFILTNYKFSNKKYIEKLSQNFKNEISFDKVFDICNFLQSEGFHPWRNNLFNCVNKLLARFSSELSPGIFHKYKMDSDSVSYSKLIDFCDSFGTMFKLHLQKSFIEARKEFNKVIDYLQIIFENFNNYLFSSDLILIELWNIMKNYYNEVAKYLTEIFPKTETNPELKEVFDEFNNLINLSEKLSIFVNDKFKNMQADFLEKIIYFYDYDNKNINSIIKAEKRSIYDKLVLVYGYNPSVWK